jgi:hypothetical protein
MLLQGTSYGVQPKRELRLVGILYGFPRKYRDACVQAVATTGFSAVGADPALSTCQPAKDRFNKMSAFMETKLARVTLGIVVLALNAPLALASTTEYTDPLSFGAAAGPLNTYNFEGIAPSGGFVQQDVTLGDATIGATFTAGSGSLDYVVDANAGIANYGASFFTGQSTDQSQYASEVVCTLSGAGTTAIGFTFGDYYQTDAGIGITASLSTGDAFLLNAPLNT